VRIDPETKAVLDLLRGLSAPLAHYVDGPDVFTMDRGRTSSPHAVKILRVAR